MHTFPHMLLVCHNMLLSFFVYAFRGYCSFDDLTGYFMINGVIRSAIKKFKYVELRTHSISERERIALSDDIDINFVLGQQTFLSAFSTFLLNVVVRIKWLVAKSLASVQNDFLRR